MNRPLDIAREFRSVDLAREPDFAIGSLRIYPSQRQIMLDQRRKTLQPRAMQVLVALAKADGAVVSREQLIERCWDGVVVGDDAINSSINKVRQVAEFGGIRHFKVETISRVGYRLHAPSADGEKTLSAQVAHQRGSDAAGAVAAPPTSSIRRHRILLIGAAMAIAAGIAAFLVYIWWPPPKEIRIAVNLTGAPIQGGLAPGLENLAAARGGLAFSDAAATSADDFALNVAVQRTGQGIEGDASLNKVGSKDLFWSSMLTANDPVLLRRRLDYAALGVLDCALEANADLRRLDDSRLRLLFSACTRAENAASSGEIAGDDLAIGLWQKAVESAPDNARALAMLAFAEAGSADSLEPDSPPVLARRQLANRHLRRALAMDPTVGIAYAAEETLLPRWRYRERLDLLDRGIASDPDSAFLLDRKAQFLADVGDSESSIEVLRRAAALAPASPVIRSDLISALAYAGYTATAAAELKDAEGVWPESVSIRDAQARFDYRFGDPNKLLHAIAGGISIPNIPGRSPSLIDVLLRARALPTPANIAAAIGLAERLAPANGPQGWLQALVYLGAVDKGYALLDNPRPVTLLRHGPTEVLFRSYMRPFLLDRRFPNLAWKLGLLQFWESSGLWPNICDDSQLPYNCREEARRLHASSPLQHT